MKIKQIAIAADQLIKAIFGGYAGETMSSRCWRLRSFQPYKTLRPVIDGLFYLWGRDHCQRSYENRMAYIPKDPE